MLAAAARRPLWSAEPSFEIPSVSGRDSGRQIGLLHRAAAGHAGAGADVGGCDGGADAGGGDDGANDDSVLVVVVVVLVVAAVGAVYL